MYKELTPAQLPIKVEPPELLRPDKESMDLLAFYYL